MALCSRAWLTLLLLACALVQISYGSRPYPGELQKPGVPSPTMVHGAAEPRRLDAGLPKSALPRRRGATGAVIVEQTLTMMLSQLRPWAGVVSCRSRGRVQGAPVLPQALGRVLGLGSKLARRVLGGEAEDSAAGPSCHSNNAHITCAPPAQH